MACGVLPQIDKQICLFESWLADHLATISAPKRAQTIRRFATWTVLPRLRRAAELKPLNASSRSHAGNQIIRATEFMAWLSHRRLTLARCNQTHLDAWLADHTINDRQGLRAFLAWTQANELTRPLTIPTQQPPHAAPTATHKRLELLGRVLTDNTIPPRTRVAAIFLLLYAQPIRRLILLTLDDVSIDDDQVFIRFGNPPTPIPEPFATVLLDYINHRENTRTATNPHTTWLFPGQRAEQPLHARTLGRHLADNGIPTTAARGSALRQHLQDSPAPIVADALGFHPVITARLVAQTAITYSRYAPGDHTQSPPPLRRLRTRDS